MPLSGISIITPVFNRRDFIVECLESVLNQSSASWELILVDDGSGDGSYEICQRYTSKDSRIRLHRRARLPKGANTCRNIGIENATYHLLMMLDSDDYLAPNCIEQRLEAVSKYPANDFWVFPQGVFTEGYPDNLVYWNTDNEEPDLDRFIRIDPVWCISGPLYRRKFLQQLGGFDEQLTCWQDFDLHLRSLRVADAYKKFYQLEPDVFIRRHTVRSTSQSGFVAVPQLDSQIRVLSKFFDMAISKAGRHNLKNKYFLLCRNRVLLHGHARTALVDFEKLHQAQFTTTREHFLGLLLLQVLYLYRRLGLSGWISDKTVNFFGKYLMPRMIGPLPSHVFLKRVVPTSFGSIE